VGFRLPGEEERLQMVAMYLEKYVLKPVSADAKPIRIEDIGEEEIKHVAKVRRKKRRKGGEGSSSRPPAIVDRERERESGEAPLPPFPPN